jgi:hypothetical protein
MGLLRSRAALLLAASGCYEPELRDCTITCNAATDCAEGQVCGSDRMCAAPALAGRCGEMPDAAGSGARDAGVTDAMIADATPDAATHAALEIAIEGKGRVNVLGYGSCDAAPPQSGSCTIIVPRDELRTIGADAHPGWRFDRWTTSACAAVGINTCTFRPTGPTPIGAKFKKGDDD